MITPQIKDELLKYLLLNCQELYYSGTCDDLAEATEIRSIYIDTILDQFEERGFVKIERYIGGFALQLRAKAFDYMQRGGHVGEFEMLDMELQKIKTELYSLEMHLEKNKFDKIMTSINTVIAFFSAAYNR
jgi:predicted translin family RNA/ssDNA-binding protein